MFKQSVITQSGQAWKLITSVTALAVGSLAPLFPVLGISWNSGTVIACAGYIFGLLAIRCRNCRRMWFWEAAKDARLYGPLFKRSECRSCEHQYDV
jgi:hypothetical protein